MIDELEAGLLQSAVPADVTDEQRVWALMALQSRAEEGDEDARARLKALEALLLGQISRKSHRRPGDGVSAHVIGCAPVSTFASKVRPPLTRDSSRMPRRGARARQQAALSTGSRPARRLPRGGVPAHRPCRRRRDTASPARPRKAREPIHRRAGDRAEGGRFFWQRPERFRWSHRGSCGSHRRCH